MESLATLVLSAYVVSPVLGLAVRTALTTALAIGAVWVWLRFFHRSRHAARRGIWSAALAGSALFSLVGPRPAHLTGTGAVTAESPAAVSWTGFEGRANEVEAEDLPVLPPTVPAVGWAFVALWIAGGLAVLLRFAQGAARGRSLSTLARPALPHDHLQAAFDEALQLTGGRGARLVISELVSVPIVVGIRRPLVVVPASMAEEDAATRAVLSHELAHVASGELAVRTVAVMCVAAQWFNPLAWLALRELKFEGELLADEAALRSGSDRGSYIRTLLSFARTEPDRWLSPIAAVIGESQLLRRVRAIARIDAKRRRWEWVAAMATVAAAVAVAWLGVSAVFARGLLLDENRGVFVGDNTPAAFISNPEH